MGQLGVLRRIRAGTASHARRTDIVVDEPLFVKPSPRWQKVVDVYRDVVTVVLRLVTVVLREHERLVVSDPHRTRAVLKPHRQGARLKHL